MHMYVRSLFDIDNVNLIVFISARSQRTAGIGRLMVVIVEGCNLVKGSNGRSDPYCEVNMGAQSHTTKTIQVCIVYRAFGIIVYMNCAILRCTKHHELYLALFLNF